MDVAVLLLLLLLLARAHALDRAADRREAAAVAARIVAHPRKQRLLRGASDHAPAPANDISHLC